MTNNDNLMGIKEVAKKLGVHWQTVRNYIDRGELKSHKVGKLVKIFEDDLNAFILGQKDVTKNIEVELRYKVKDVKKLQHNLIDLGAHMVQQSHIIDHWYIPIGIRNMKEEVQWFDVKRGTGVRIREYINEYGNHVTTALETKRMTLAMNHDTFLETSMVIESYAKGNDFMIMNDRKEYLTIDKSRILYKFDVYKIVIDSIKGYGSGMEIEYAGENKSRELVILEIQSLAKELGLTEKDRFEKSFTVDVMETLAKF